MSETIPDRLAKIELSNELLKACCNAMQEQMLQMAELQTRQNVFNTEIIAATQRINKSLAKLKAVHVVNNEIQRLKEVKRDYPRKDN